MQQPDEVLIRVQTRDAGVELDDTESTSSSLSFDSLSSLENSGLSETSQNEEPAWKRRIILQRHIQDTMDRLYGHALLIERAGTKHRRERMELYKQKDGPREVYETFKRIGEQKARDTFKSASESFQQRIGESFARRRNRFAYLKAHQKKRAADAGVQKQCSQVASTPQPTIPQTTLNDHGIQPPLAGIQGVQGRWEKAAFGHPDQNTVYSATAVTKLDTSVKLEGARIAESVASVALRHVRFPLPPRIKGDGFQCPYCCLEFRRAEAGRDRWR